MAHTRNEASGRNVAEGLCLSVRFNQHFVGYGFVAEADCEEACKAGMAVATSIEAEDELVEIGLEILAAQSVIDAERPGLEVGEHAMDPGEHDVGGHRADDMRFVFDILGAGIGSPAVGLGGGVLGEIVGEEAVQGGGGEVLDLGEPDASGPSFFDLDCTGDQQLALGAAATAAGYRVLFRTTGKGGFVGLDQAFERRTAGCHHGETQLGGEEPGGFVRPETELLLQLQGGDAVGMAGHQIGGPEPDGEAELRTVHDRAGGHRGLFVAARAFEGEDLGLERPGFHAAAARAHEAIRPACFDQIIGAGPLIGKALLELQK